MCVPQALQSSEAALQQKTTALHAQAQAQAQGGEGAPLAARRQDERRTRMLRAEVEVSAASRDCDPLRQNPGRGLLRPHDMAFVCGVAANQGWISFLGFVCM